MSICQFACLYSGKVTRILDCDSRPFSYPKFKDRIVSGPIAPSEKVSNTGCFPVKRKIALVGEVSRNDDHCYRIVEECNIWECILTSTIESSRCYTSDVTHAKSQQPSPAAGYSRRAADLLRPASRHGSISTSKLHMVTWRENSCRIESNEHACT